MTDTEIIAAYIAEVEQRAEAATKGPWVQKSVKGYGGYNVIISESADCPGWVTARLDQTVLYKEDINADFIAHSRTDLPKALEMLKVAMDALKEYADNTIHPIGDEASLAIATIRNIITGEKA